MANGINLNLARIAETAIARTINNGRRFSTNGFLQAARSPQNAELITDMNPRNANNDGRLSVDQTGSTPTAQVRLSYRPMVDMTVDTTRAVAGSSGTTPTAATSLLVNYALHREQKHKYGVMDMLGLEKAAETYLTNPSEFTPKVKGFSLLSNMGDEICRKIDPLLQSVNTAVGTALLAAAGGNLMIGAASPANLAVPNVNGFKADGSLHTDFYDWLKNLRVIHNIAGRLIVVGGLKPQTWFNRKGIASAASLGYDYEKMMEDLDVEFYYEPRVDVLFGTDQVCVIEAGAFCFESWLEHAPLNEGGVIPMEEHNNTYFGNCDVNIAQSMAPTFGLEMDLRVEQLLSTAAYPIVNIIPSIKFGVFARPAGLIKNYGGWETHTGIFRAKLVTAA
ncbi:hypothetical protein [Fibrivirga algicola]|uniref:DUF2184 domain-containing protein n=1 Tax=Fibrivirga algicola TaxID=2950420 RepID=A0ABX0QBA9_9BACT|nr:hypothetical protein [Fibrivirga algicola]NID09364.1 hypothetical protein [Fibrivirga algicola]